MKTIKYDLGQNPLNMVHDQEKIAARLKNRFFFLSGFMGTGKSAVGSRLADRLGVPFYDVDQHVIDAGRMPIADIFTTYGEVSFRERESKALIKIIRKGGPAVIALGGGTFLRKTNTDIVRSNGVIINLKSDPDSILERLGEIQIKSLLIMCGKPLSYINSWEKILESIIELNERRKTLYDNADFSVFTGGKTVDDVTEEILGQLEYLFPN